MTEAVASAPAKAMLFGEYAVLEGAPAVALALDKRIRARASFGSGTEVRSDLLPGGAISIPDGELARPRPPHPVLRFVWPLIQAAGPGLRLAFEAEFPPVWGLGSSSASTVAAAAALDALGGGACDRLTLFRRVLDRQRDVQGAASGYDVATQLVGGCALFRGGDPPALERIPGPESWPWIVAWTGDKVSTGSMIRSVRGRHPVGSPIYGRIGDLAEAAADLLRRGDRRAVGEALTEGQGLLQALGASPEWATAAVARLAAAPGVLGARLSGAGGGDCVVLLASDVEAARAAVNEAGLTALDLRVDPEGLTVERDPA